MTTTTKTATHAGPLACPICREQIGNVAHHLSYDGHGINGCGMYRTRLATFGKDAPRDLLGPLFAAAPDLLEACRVAREHCGRLPDDAWTESLVAILDAAIAKATGEA